MEPYLREFRWRTDYETVLSFQKEVYETNFPGFRMSSVFLRDYEQQLRQALRHPSEKLYVLEDDQGVCGFLWLALITTMVEPLVGYIKNIYVAPRRRRQGYAQMMLEEAERWFRAHGCEKAALDASVCNPRAVEIYLHAGYHIARLRMEKNLLAKDDIET